MKSIIPNISVNNCQEAMEFYKNVFGGELKNVKIADTEEMFKGHEGKVMHSELHVGKNCVIYLTDIFGDKSQSSHIQMILGMDSKQEIEKVYADLIKEGKAEYELQKTFWGAYHAVVRDKYGITWGLDYNENN
ncbi:VOC family protein [Clostridium sp. BNL1100]|uniref:VOC family protein n=1 Tax=Clostridium sp. BNL1100 TaxID=755731 RepID=UPI00024A76FA|nr:VOC family protein [Clostridium sp. BNL1100]AEY66486.1 hypothetical protein Clo1100_2311 [Clostridium sp. BNL1100]